MTKQQIEPGSFRDRDGRVFYQDGRVLRALSGKALEDWRHLAGTEFWSRLSDGGKVVGTREAEVAPEDLRELSPIFEAAIEHDRIPFISYPYEWSFHMLRDAALLQLDLMLAALGEHMILKDATPYNVQFQGHRPVFIDIASFEKWRQGEPWIGYQQFCQLFLYPLMLAAYRDIPYAPWLRGSIDGILPEQCNALMSWRDRFRPGVLIHVYLHAKMQASDSQKAGNTTKDLQKAGFRKELIVSNVKQLRRIVGKMTWKRSDSEWAAYADDNSYDEENRSLKADFVDKVAAQRSWNLVWDIGGNTGEYSRIAAKYAEQVVTIDADPLAVDRMYLALKKDGPDNILPLVNNLADSSPSLGWRHSERKSLDDRSKPELVLCLALIHHIVISANVPLPEFIEYLAQLEADLVIEFVTRDDAMVKKLLRHRRDIFHDYEVDAFEQALGRHFELVDSLTYLEGTRRLYYARPKA